MTDRQRQQTQVKLVFAFPFAFVAATRPQLKDVVQEVECLERELCEGKQQALDPVPCPAPGARLAFYIASLTKPNTTGQRNAKKQLQLALPLNLFLTLHVRKWTSFYVQNLSNTIFI